ncbi:MAG: RsmB/NOP family class I SAM-dependent RNA methyltransferase, partial [Planctomycetaceae bacterium]
LCLMAIASLSPRELAHDVLLRGGDRRQIPTRLLDEQLAQCQLTPGQRGQATDLVHGVVRRQPTLDLILRQFLRRPLPQVEAGALVWLRLAAWELLFSATPSYAVLNETAEAVKRQGQPQWTGFLNGVLRSLTRDLTDQQVFQPAPNALPLDSGNYRVLQSSPFPDPQTDPQGYFRDAFSFPEWLVARWAGRVEYPRLLRLGFWFNTPPRPTLRVNTLVTTRDALLERLQQQEISAEPGQHPHAIRLGQSARVTALPGFDEGWFAVQDESAMEAATRLAPQPGERILDLCAAPGGKTLHLAALMQNQGQIIAADSDERRLKQVADSARRLHSSIITCEMIPADTSRLPAGPFDAVLLDVPCSNTGVLGKRPEVRWRLTPRDLVELPQIQSRLLNAAVRVCRPGGRLLYSTCSIEPEENGKLIQAALKRHRQLRLVEERQHWPGEPVDGGYQALLHVAPVRT